MNLYFGGITETASTILVVVIWVYFFWSVTKCKNEERWGRKSAILAMTGLVACCFVATRDGYHLSVQASFDDTVMGGLFAIDSIQSALCSIGGAVIAFSTLSSAFVKNQKYRKVMFLILGMTIIFKTLIIEISRWVVCL